MDNNKYDFKVPTTYRELMKLADQLLSDIRALQSSKYHPHRDSLISLKNFHLDIVHSKAKETLNSSSEKKVEKKETKPAVSRVPTELNHLVQELVSLYASSDSNCKTEMLEHIKDVNRFAAINNGSLALD
ncbi:hypothetical protein VIBNISO65_1780028 [Vibrio nigripulchritudo SO65]|uniref:hypothetical protein n=1 Tax=Vibrio nigripulchritudo TaxID=28173 RepID=UPI0003B2328C|nr:hypothetical protein [Vibrio nigripulchritudo]CCN34421.1 hypothetical protein VIBNIAM115_1480027 [Vibrio nigripulchritudo AM115]CCN43321.1 hypothetical protein VIBNIFTn2_50066 [Vibrio nigripulchritudo FTn2]CCN63721.1 hypothetical protein VIBNIPon4_150051 [Vibrio nigripulchritudo POn4]CCN77046.1 hypothetical protein VIBNISO65_1780028 [Vibrio nigripulchritudo SO65]